MPREFNKVTDVLAKHTLSIRPVYFPPGRTSKNLGSFPLDTEARSKTLDKKIEYFDVF